MDNLLAAIKMELQNLDLNKLKKFAARLSVEYLPDGSAEMMIDSEVVAVCGRSRAGY